jgi:hypothetical protein
MDSRYAILRGAQVSGAIAPPSRTSSDERNCAHAGITASSPSLQAKRSNPHIRTKLDCFASLAMTETKKAGIAPGLLFSPRHARPCAGHPRLASKKVVDGRVKPGHDDVWRPQFEALFGGEAGHDLISAS